MLLIIPHLSCNISCRYCYESNYRKEHKTKVKDYDLDILFKRMTELKNVHPEMCLHGGEPLMLPKEDVRALLLKMKELTGKSSIQTNGVLIDDDFIEIFKECSTTVGLSYDGPGELSEYRFYKLKKDPELDKKINKMIKEKISVSLIIVVSKSNAGTNQRLKKLKDFLLKSDKIKINGRLNPCGCAPGYELNDNRRKEAYLDLARFCLYHNLKWSPFTDIINALQGKSRVCVFSDCDPFCTSSAAELMGDGSLTNCMRTNQDYILLRHPEKHNTRNEILFQTPQEFGGCEDCQYWHACYGGCSTMTIDNDWRNRTYLCSTWKALFQFYEKTLAHCGIFCNSCQPIKQDPCQKHVDSNHQDLDHGDQTEHQDHIDYSYREETKEMDFGSKHIDSDHRNQREHIDHLDDSHNDSLFKEPFPLELKNEIREISPGYYHADSDHGDRIEHNDSN